MAHAARLVANSPNVRRTPRSTATALVGTQNAIRSHKHPLQAFNSVPPGTLTRQNRVDTTAVMARASSNQDEDRSQVGAVFEVFRSAEANAPYDTGRIKIFFPAVRSSEVIKEPDRGNAPYPVVILLIGAFVELNRYQWLAERLVRETKVVVACSDAVLPFREQTILLPYSRNVFDVSPSADLEVILSKLDELNKQGPLKGIIDTNRLVLGGHSAGARFAMEHAAATSAPEIVAVFSYGAHIAQAGDGSQELFLKEVMDVPALILVGSNDGVLERFSFQYGTKWTSAAEPVRRTFEESLKDDRSGVYVEFDGFNHFAIVDPVDSTMGSQPYDSDSEVEKSVAIEELGRVISLFVKEHAHGDQAAAKELRDHLKSDHALIKDVKMHL